MELTSLVGRRDELLAIRRSLGTARLLTLTGPGGVGKTRLALRTARDLAPQFDAGSTLVPLAEIEEGGQVAQAVATALGLQDRSSEWSTAALAEHLAERRLLILDNCEHVLESVAALSGGLLRACADLVILCTSRQPLGVAGEVVTQVPPMAMPPEGSSTAEAWRSDAVSLFVERAAARGGGFTLDANSAPAVLDVCRQLDGLPLALELAAVRLDSLGIASLSAALGDRILELGSGDRSDLPRRRTMEATIDWSYRLLTADEQVLWSRLSVFLGGFELDAATAVCADDSLPPAAIRTILAGLVEKSLVVRLSANGRERFRLLEVLRQFAAARLLEAGEQPAILARHLGWVETLAAVAGAHDDREPEAFARIRAERANLWGALEFCLDDGRYESAAAICRDLLEYWLTDGHFSEVLGLLGRLRASAPRLSRAHADGLWVAAIISASQSEPETALALATESVEIGRTIGDASAVAYGLTALAAACWAAGRVDEAIDHATDAASLARTMSLRFELLVATDVKGIAQVFHGDIESGVETGRATIALSEALGETAVRGYALHFLSIAALRQGDLAEATRLATTGVEIRSKLGDVTGIAHLAEVLAFVAAADDDHERATMLLGGADAIWRAVSGKEYEPLIQDQIEAKATAIARLGDVRYRAAYAAGLALGIDEVTELALGRAVPLRAAAPRPAVRSATDLSRRELEVARLVADGASNATTASQLFISERTVESHVTNILNKLGVDTRVQIARWVAALPVADA